MNLLILITIKMKMQTKYWNLEIIFVLHWARLTIEFCLPLLELLVQFLQSIKIYVVGRLVRAAGTLTEFSDSVDTELKRALEWLKQAEVCNRSYFTYSTKVWTALIFLSATSLVVMLPFSFWKRWLSTPLRFLTFILTALSVWKFEF